MVLRAREGANAKLTREDVIAMRKRYAEGATQRELCQVYGISITAVGRIVRGETWGWLTEEMVKAPAPTNYDAPLPPMTEEMRAEAAASAERLKALLEKKD